MKIFFLSILQKIGNVFFIESTIQLLFGFCCVALVNALFTLRHNTAPREKTKSFIFKKIFISFIFLLILSSFKCYAQTEDSLYTDTLSRYDTVIKADDIAEAPDATTEKHVYDSSVNYFTRKENRNDPYTNYKIKSRHATDSTVNQLRNNDEFWYVKAIEKFKHDIVRLQTDKAFRDSLTKAGYLKPDEQVFTQEQQSSSFLATTWFKFIIWAIIIGVFVYAVAFFLMANKINLFTRGDVSASSGFAEEDHTDIFHLPYKDLLQKAYNEKNYRFAIRILYLQTLKLMSEKNIIKFQPEFTNMHYLLQLNRSNYFKDFFSITHHYEYVWYGKFDVTEDMFNKMQNDFSSMQNKILNA